VREWRHVGEGAETLHRGRRQLLVLREGRATLRVPLGEAVQADPIKPKLKPPGTNLLTLKHDELLSNFAFKFNLRRHSLASTACGAADCQARLEGPHTRPLLSTT